MAASRTAAASGSDAAASSVTAIFVGVSVSDESVSSEGFDGSSGVSSVSLVV